MKDEGTGTLHTPSFLWPARLYYVQLSFTWVFKWFDKVNEVFCKMFYILICCKTKPRGPNILVLTSLSRPERHLQRPLCTELDLCLAKWTEANVWNAFDFIYNIFDKINYAGEILSTRITTKEWKKLRMIIGVRLLEWFQRFQNKDVSLGSSNQ